MKFWLILLLVFFSGPILAQDTEFTITGEYQGKNIYVQNPLSGDKINFCTSEVYLNERLVSNSPKTSAYEIDLAQLSIGDPVLIKIIHKEGCLPKVINPQVVRSKSKFQFLNVNADALSVHWSTIGELPYGNFFVEHYKNKSWINIKTLSGKGSFEANQYDVEPAHHSGDNKYRIKYVQSNDKIFFSPVFQYFSNEEPISFFPALVIDRITLSRASDYAVVDSYGNEIVSGSGIEIELEQLKAGLYFLYVDNREEKFVKK